MDVADIVLFMKKLHLENIKPDSRGEWMRASCPFAFDIHGKRTDNDPSFGISIHPGGESRYNCFGCNSVGEITGLLGKLERFDIKNNRRMRFDYSDLDAWVRVRNPVATGVLAGKRERASANAPWSGVPQAVARAPVEPDPLPEDALLGFERPPPFLREYLHQRNMTDKSINAWEIRWHEKANRIAIPIRDSKNRLVGISGRAWEKRQKPKFLHSAHFGRDFYLYGEKTLRRGEPGYLCEGFFDVIVLQQYGINAFAIMGTHISRQQVQKCVDWLTEVVVMLDGDEAGLKFAGGVKDRLLPRIHARIVTLPQGKDPDELPESELKELIRV